jgi:hypothetical protein
MDTEPFLRRGRLRRVLGAYSDGVGVHAVGSIHTSPSHHARVSRLSHHGKKEKLRKESAACNNIRHETIYRDLDKKWTLRKSRL